MHSWLPSGPMERAISARRILVLAMIMFMVFALPAIAQQAQPATTPAQQPGSVANPEPGAMAQHQVANPPGEAPSHEAGGEANLQLPDLRSLFPCGIDGHKMLLFGLIFCVFGLVFGLVIYMRLKNLPVHQLDARDFRADL